MTSIAIRDCKIVNEGSILEGDVYIRGERIEKVGGIAPSADLEINANHQFLLPGLIDDQVHFREPGLTHKADIFSESRAAAAGGVTSFMEMPNTAPPAITHELLEEKFQIAAKNSAVNYTFYFGLTNDNAEDALRLDPSRVCGIKAFLSSSTGDMLVDNENTLRQVFRDTEMVVACHCEDENIILRNLELAIRKFGDDIPLEEHPRIRSREACFASSSKMVALAKELGTKLHVLHLSTKEELSLFDAGDGPKQITSEACIHHLWFSDLDYGSRGAFIKWNPAIKGEEDREALRDAVIDGRIDIIATDHAPHTKEEKAHLYTSCPSGGPLVQHSLLALFELWRKGIFPLELIVKRACHTPAERFQIRERGFIREGYFADLVLVDPKQATKVTPESLLYKCGWSPFEGIEFSSKVTTTIVNGAIVYDGERINGNCGGKRLEFNA